MGAASSKPLVDYTAEEVQEYVKNLGAKYASVAEEAIENGIHGKFLDELTEEEFGETLEDLGVTSRLQVRFLTKEWKASKEAATAASSTAAATTTTAATEDKPKKTKTKKKTEIETAKALPISFEPLHHRSRKNKTSEGPSEDEESKEDPPGVVLPEPLRAVQKYGISKDMPDSDVEAFGKIAEKVFNSTDVMYAAIHMIDPTGYATLGSRYRPTGATSCDDVCELRHDGDCNSICHQVILQETGDYITKRIPPGYIDLRCLVFHDSIKEGDGEALPYYQSQIIRDNETGARVGVICTVAQQEMVPEKQDILAQLAAETSALLQERQYLLQRNEQLRQQIGFAEEEKQAN